MFDLFRSRAKAVRYLLGALLMIVALSMVVTLIPGFGTGGGGQDQVVAEIGKETLTVRDVQEQMQAVMRNRAVPPEMAGFFAQQLIDEMISTRALMYEAKRMGMDVTDADLARMLRTNFPQLFPNGQFVGKEGYAAILQQQGMTIQQFENQLRQQMLLGRVSSVATDTVMATPAEVTQEYHRRNDKVKLDYIEVTPEKFKSEVTVSPEAVASYYAKTREQYRLPEKRSFDLVYVDEAKLAQKLTVPDDELRRIYDTNKDQFRLPERVHARHILLKTTGKPQSELPQIQAKAQELLKQIKAGADFAELARKNSEDPGSGAKGGDLGWIARGQTVPPFENTAFSLKPKELSGIVTTQYGLHIIQVLEKEDAHVKPFEEVKTQLAEERKRQQVFETMQKIADQAHEELLKNPQQAAAIAQRLGADFVHVSQVTAQTEVPEFGKSPDFSQAIAGLAKAGVTPVVQGTGQSNKLGVAVVTEVVPSRPAELADVAPRIKAMLETQDLASLVGTRAKQAFEKAKAEGGDLRKVASSMGLEVKSTQEFAQTGAADGIGPAQLLEPAFHQAVGSVFGPVSRDTSFFVCKIVNRSEADMSQLAAQKAEIQTTIKERKAKDEGQLFMDSVRAALTRQGKVKVHKEVMDRVLASYRS